MIKFGEVLEKFPPELKNAVIALYDFLREEYVIKREEFEELKNIVKSLAIAQEKTEERLNQLVIVQQKTEERISQLTVAQQKTEERINQLTVAQQKTEERLNQLAIAQQKTEERLNQLVIAQQKTEERINQLTIAQQKTEERLNQLAEAQRKTEEELRSLTRTVKRIQKELGGISHSIGFDLENQAYKGLPKILKEKHNIDLTERLLRKFIEYPDGREEEINIFGKGKKDGEEVYIIGEAKTHLKLKDIDTFKKRLERINKVIPYRKFPLFVVHSCSPKIVKYAEDNGFPVFFSYEF
ncbi:MAG: chordopoxvirus fusion protein [Candidatus Omnitrophica bacterium]|nr:chordopoxvirus fusion protein [Candidatus Omnitrophota bacterium]MCM8803497.1 chordopoxvirus fusion protein [Candidatus Omnitrophota bacterium]